MPKARIASPCCLKRRQAGDFRLAGSETLNAFDRMIGLKRIRAFHLNDSKVPAGSKKDRHENIGEGEIGIDAFKRLVTDPRFEHCPMILETPGGDSTTHFVCRRIDWLYTDSSRNSMILSVQNMCE